MPRSEAQQVRDLHIDRLAVAYQRIGRSQDRRAGVAHAARLARAERAIQVREVAYVPEIERRARMRHIREECIRKHRL